MGLSLWHSRMLFVYQACNFANQLVKIERGSDCMQGIDPACT